MRKKRPEKSNYLVRTVQQAKEVAINILREYGLNHVVTFGLPEIDDRIHAWRVPLKSERGNNGKIGEIVINAKTSLIDRQKSTDRKLIEKRLLKKKVNNNKEAKKDMYKLSQLRNTIGYGDSEELLDELPSESVDLIFTSPPYFNAKPEYTEYLDYDDYLNKMRKIIRKCHRVLSNGRFFVINVSPILIRRANRNESSKRIAVPFDFHSLFIKEDFEFIDDIIWVKPEGAGWATGRGRRFSADRNALQYKAVPVTEYVLVYRKKTDKLIDWYLRNHPNPEIVKESRISSKYDKTNIWRIHPAHHKEHPAVFPVKLAEKVIKYYSFINDVVLDPFAGVGTVGKVAIRLRRRFVLFDNNKKYINIIKREIGSMLSKKEARNVICLNSSPLDLSQRLT